MITPKLSLVLFGDIAHILLLGQTSTRENVNAQEITLILG